MMLEDHEPDEQPQDDGPTWVERRNARAQALRLPEEPATATSTADSVEPVEVRSDDEATRERPPLVLQHPYREEIEGLLRAGWSPRMVNLALSRMYAKAIRPYEPVGETTLRRYKAAMKAVDMRPVAEWEKKLADEHVLLDTVRMRGAMLITQGERVQKALEFETTMNQGGMNVVLPLARFEIETWLRIASEYDEAVERALGKQPSMTLINAPLATTVQVANVDPVDLLAAEIRRMPESLRDKMVSWLEQRRQERRDAKVREATDRAKALMPPLNGAGT